MRLNHDCVRAILLACEKTKFNQTLSKDDLITALPKYNQDDILYCLLKLSEVNYITMTRHSANNNPFYICDIHAITWDGHKFLDTIRDDEVWKNTKTILGNVSSASITFASNVASQVLTNIISKQMGLM